MTGSSASPTRALRVAAVGAESGPAEKGASSNSPQEIASAVRDWETETLAVFNEAQAQLHSNAEDLHARRKELLQRDEAYTVHQEELTQLATAVQIALAEQDDAERALEAAEQLIKPLTTHEPNSTATTPPLIAHDVLRKLTALSSELNRAVDSFRQSLHSTEGAWIARGAETAGYLRAAQDIQLRLVC